MNPWQDKATASIKIAIDILFVKNPIGTSMGIVTGVILDGVIGLFSPLFALLKINTAALNIGHYIAIGVFGFNVGNFRKRHKISPEIEEAISFIDRMQKDGKITAAQAKIHYLALITKVVENVQFDEPTQKQIDAIEKAFVDESAKKSTTP